MRELSAARKHLGCLEAKACQIGGGISTVASILMRERSVDGYLFDNDDWPDGHEIENLFLDMAATKATISKLTNQKESLGI